MTKKIDAPLTAPPPHYAPHRHLFADTLFTVNIHSQMYIIDNEKYFLQFFFQQQHKMGQIGGNNGLEREGGGRGAVVSLI